MIALPKLPDLKPRERLLAAGCGVVLLIVFLDRLVMAPWSRHARTVRQEVHRMQEALQVHARLLTRRERVLGERDQYQRYLRPIEADELEKASLIKEVQDLAARTSVTIGDIKALEVESGRGARRYPLEVRFLCTLEAWVNFMYELESSPSLYQIIRAGLSVREGEADRLDGYVRVVRSALPPPDESDPSEHGGGHAPLVN